VEDYKPNSNRFKAEQKNKMTKAPEKVEKVVTGKVLTKKKSAFSKFTDEIISEDAKNVKSYVLGEVLIPAIKKAISDIVTDGIDMILYGESRKGGRRTTADRVSYTSYSSRAAGPRDYRTPSFDNRYSYDDIILANRADAQDVLDRMDEIVETYGVVTVADLKDLVGISGAYTDNKYGWTSTKAMDVIRTRDGYMIKTPRAMPID
jgi:hypothetical protein